MAKTIITIYIISTPLLKWQVTIDGSKAGCAPTWSQTIMDVYSSPAEALRMGKTFCAQRGMTPNKVFVDGVFVTKKMSLSRRNYPVN